MAIAKVTEIIASSNKSFEDALQQGVERANKTLENVIGILLTQGHALVNVLSATGALILISAN